MVNNLFMNMMSLKKIKQCYIYNTMLALKPFFSEKEISMTKDLKERRLLSF